MRTIEEIQEEDKVVLRSDAYFDKYKIHKVCERCGKEFKTKYEGAKVCKFCLKNPMKEFKPVKDVTSIDNS